MDFSFLTKGKYFVNIISVQKYLKYILLLGVDTWPLSLAPMIGDTGGSWKKQNLSEEKILLSQYQHAKKPDVTGKNYS